MEKIKKNSDEKDLQVICFFKIYLFYSKIYYKKFAEKIEIFLFNDNY